MTESESPTLMAENGMNRTRKIALSSLMLVIGITLPQLFHLVGLGAAFLPMHIPVLLCGMLLGPFFGGFLGVITPLLSSFLTGMPPIMPPVAIIMSVELLAMGTAAGLLRRNLQFNPYLVVLGSALAGRLVFAAIVMVLGSYFLNLDQAPPTYLATSLLLGIPGFILQLAVIPPLCILLEKFIFRTCRV